MARRTSLAVRVVTHGAAWLECSELVATWGGLDPSLTAVRQWTGGKLPGTAELVMPEVNARTMVRELRGHPHRGGDLTELERSALREIASTLVNACVTALATTTGHEVTTGLPEVILGSAEELAPQAEQRCLVTLARILIRGTTLAEGYLSWTMEPSVASSLRCRLTGSIAANLVAVTGVGGVA